MLFKIIVLSIKKVALFDCGNLFYGYLKLQGDFELNSRLFKSPPERAARQVLSVCP